MITALPMFSHSPSIMPWTTRQRMRKSVSDASPRSAPDTWGCMWTMSVPRATWIVHGIPARRAAHTRLMSACGQPMSSMYWPRAAPRPIPFSRPIRAAWAKASAVSRAMPKWPPGSWAATSSLVFPARASSKSWMAADPFMAMQPTTSRRIQSIRYGAQPTLMTCPPMATATVCFSRWHRTTWSRNFRRSTAANCRGKVSIQSPMAVDGATGRPRSATTTLLGRSESGYVFRPLRSRGSITSRLRACGRHSTRHDRTRPCHSRIVTRPAPPTTGGRPVRRVGA